MSKKIVVIYHRADFDGIFCREIAQKALGDTAEYIGWDYGDTDAIIPPGVEYIIMLDISVDAWMSDPRLIWIDHHKSAIKKYVGRAGYQIDGVAACRLAWQWFNNDKSPLATDFFAMPTKADYVERLVKEPLAVRLAGEYDIWDKRDPRAELFQHGLRSRDLSKEDWRWLLTVVDAAHQSEYDLAKTHNIVTELLLNGEMLQFVKRQEDAGIITSYGFELEFEGLKFLACNHARFNSHLFTAGLQPHHEALLGFNYDGQKGDWRVSLYHAPGHEDLDLSVIAAKFGGGGHRGACGFRIKELEIPMLLAGMLPHDVKSDRSRGKTVEPQIPGKPNCDWNATPQGTVLTTCGHHIRRPAKMVHDGKGCCIFCGHHVVGRFIRANA